jgi:hypothetical protein
LRASLGDFVRPPELHFVQSGFYEVTTIAGGLEDKEDSPFVMKHIMLIGVLQTVEKKRAKRRKLNRSLLSSSRSES